MIELNYREVIRRGLKYIILVSSVILACVSITNKLNNKELIIIGGLTGLMYCLLDITMPSIKLDKNKN